MRAAWIAALVAAGTAWGVGSLREHPGAEAPTADTERLLHAIEARIEALESGARSEPLLESRSEPPRWDALEDRIAALEKALASLESALRATTRPAAPHRAGPPTRTGDFERRLESARRLAPAERARPLYRLAMEMRALGRHEDEEGLLRELIDAAGPDLPLAKEASYQIGWARANRGDHAGARDAWFAARENFPPGHWRRDYARYYAAEQAVEMNDRSLAERELGDLLRDLEASGEEGERKTTILGRTRHLLASLAR